MEKKEEESKFEIIEIGSSDSIQLPQVKKKELKIQWKDDEWLFETKTEEECNSWFSSIEHLQTKYK